MLKATMLALAIVLGATAAHAADVRTRERGYPGVQEVQDAASRGLPADHGLPAELGLHADRDGVRQSDGSNSCTSTSTSSVTSKASARTTSSRPHGPDGRRPVLPAGREHGPVLVPDLHRLQGHLSDDRDLHAVLSRRDRRPVPGKGCLAQCSGTNSEVARQLLPGSPTQLAASAARPRPGPGPDLPGSEPDVPLDRRRRRVDADRPHADRVAQMPAEGGVHVEQLADLRAQHLRHRLARRLGGAAERGRAPKRLASWATSCVELGAQPLGAPDVGELLGLVELRAQVVEPRAVLAAGALIGGVVERAARCADRESVAARPATRARAASRRTPARGARARAPRAASPGSAGPCRPSAGGPGRRSAPSRRRRRGGTRWRHGRRAVRTSFACRRSTRAVTSTSPSSRARCAASASIAAMRSRSSASGCTDRRTLASRLCARATIGGEPMRRPSRIAVSKCRAASAGRPHRRASAPSSSAHGPRVWQPSMLHTSLRRAMRS